MPRSNFFKAHTITNDGIPQETVCRSCRGSGEDPCTPDADCLACWGEGTIPLQSPSDAD